MILIFSSAEWCFRVARRMSFTIRPDGVAGVPDFCLICASPWSYDEPEPKVRVSELLPSSSQPVCLMSADAGQHRPQSL